MILTWTLLPVVAAAWLALYLWQCWTSPVSQVPGTTLSRFTSAPLRWHEFRANRTLYIHSLHLKYGPVVRLAPGELSFTSYEAVKEIYGSFGSGYDKTKFYNMFRVFGRRTMFSTLEKNDVRGFYPQDWIQWISAYVKQHAKRKRIIADRYANSNVVKPAAVSGIESRALEFTRQCEEASGSSVDIYMKLHSYACDGVTHNLFHPFGSNCLQNEEDRIMMHQATNDNSLQSRLLQHHYPVIYTYMSRIIDLFLEPRATPLANAFINEKSNATDPAPFTLLSRLQEKIGSDLDVTDIAAECQDHMVAGIDTTGDALCFLMWQLSQPESAHIMQDLQKELRANRDTNFDKLPFLDAVVQEGLRCFPAIPMSLPRHVPQDGRNIDGYFIPQGTIVSSQAYSVNRHNSDVFPDPDRFNPYRWMEPEGDAERRRLMFSFSHGGRGCVGKHLAFLEMKLLLRHVYVKFTTVPDPATTRESMIFHDQIISSRPLGQNCLLKFVPIAED